MQQPIVVLATRSPDKLREIRSILTCFTSAGIISLDDAGVREQPDEEQLEAFDSFLENARAKARYFTSVTGLPAIADDSGISVDALDGRPGVRSKRFARAPGLTGADLDAANNERLLHELRDVPDSLRAAHYTCAAVLALPDGRRLAALGTCSGRILREPRGSGGFGYDPLFLMPPDNITFAEMPPELKHTHSHRGRAFRALGGILEHAL